MAQYIGAKDLADMNQKIVDNDFLLLGALTPKLS